MHERAVFFGVEFEVDGFGAGDDSGVDFGFEVYDFAAEESDVFVLVGGESGTFGDSAEHEVFARDPDGVRLVFVGDFFEDGDKGWFEDFIGIDDEYPVVLGLGYGEVAGGFDETNGFVEEEGGSVFGNYVLGAIG